MSNEPILDEPASQPKTPKNNNKTILYIVLGVIVFCCLCCVALLIGQYLLENSNFSLVQCNTLFHLIVHHAQYIACAINYYKEKRNHE